MAMLVYRSVNSMLKNFGGCNPKWTTGWFGDWTCFSRRFIRRVFDFVMKNGSVLWVGVIQRRTKNEQMTLQGTRRKHIPNQTGYVRKSDQLFGGYLFEFCLANLHKTHKLQIIRNFALKHVSNVNKTPPKSRVAYNWVSHGTEGFFNDFSLFWDVPPRKFTCTPKKETMRKLHLPTINFQRICYFSQGVSGQIY